MKKKLLFVYNPKAGKEKIRESLADVLDIFAEADYDMTVVPTRRRDEAREVVRDRKRDYDLVVCSGGDGTLDETVTGMIQSGFSTPVGYIPAGSTNDYGESLGLSRNMAEAARTAITGRDYACDMGSFNDDIFVYIAAFGLFTDVSYETDQAMKNVLGHMAYVLEGMKRLSNVRSYPLKITHDGEVIEDEFIFGMITNSRSVGGFKNITGKNVEMDDGLFEVTLIKMPTNPVELSAILNSLVNRDVDTDMMYCFRTSELTVESEEPLAWTLDGENGGAHEKALIKNLHKTVQIRVD
ncbi:MAG: diacylglycerol kinase family lipid kinase [Lachnospiraceae bacterium]|nr:diacylglycerol kinase family lipid kinase [Lachnospiraceae bacterium]